MGGKLGQSMLIRRFCVNKVVLVNFMLSIILSITFNIVKKLSLSLKPHVSKIKCNIKLYWGSKSAKGFKIIIQILYKTIMKEES